MIRFSPEEMEEDYGLVACERCYRVTACTEVLLAGTKVLTLMLCAKCGAQRETERSK